MVNIIDKFYYKFIKKFHVIILFISFTLFIIPFSHAINKPDKIFFLCDFKLEEPHFYELNSNGKLTEREVAIVSLIPIYNKFVGKQIYQFGSEYYIYGYFLSIHDRTEGIATDPIGAAFVKRQELICVNIDNLK